MSGHSKWATIKHKKGALDAKRGKVFTKIIREITVAAREGGGNQDANPRLRLAVQKAKDANMPADNIDRAIKKGTGELEGVSYENISFEGYAPGGVAVIADVLTDNRNRTTSEVRSIFTKRGGNMAGAGSVAFQFEKKGVFMVKRSDFKEEDLFNIVLDVGADDMTSDEEFYEVTCPPQDFDKVRTGLLKAKVKVESSELGMMPKNTVKVEDPETAKKVMNLVNDLEDHDDVQNVYTNFDIPDEILKQIEG
ncbi:MAG: YebC/PmpR family DNA-binding transcriptional regulator [Candidatus Omnitrophica bacterium]|jgi:YebC/PmpR family DNA-binding regulatory protein|nr:YebC/PmpR family DNA-binding transcriptional regulator [Candidatus Omnitrophota bacterium]